MSDIEHLQHHELVQLVLDQASEIEAWKNRANAAEYTVSKCEIEAIKKMIAKLFLNGVPINEETIEYYVTKLEDADGYSDYIYDKIKDDLLESKWIDEGE